MLFRSQGIGNCETLPNNPNCVTIFVPGQGEEQGTSYIVTFNTVYDPLNPNAEPEYEITGIETITIFEAVTGDNDLNQTDEAVAEQKMIEEMNRVPNFDQYYKPVYPQEIVFYADEEPYADRNIIPENNRALRNALAQEITHRRMVLSQWEDK